MQYCPEEVSTTGIRVTWYQSLQENFIRSDPLCINNETIITRNCTNDGWVPPLSEVLPCHTAVDHLNPSLCPPGFKTISYNNKYCYQIVDPSPWQLPCFQSGGATVITELNENETITLLDSLSDTNYKYFWLPAQRQKTFTPIVWVTPGPNWGRVIESNNIRVKDSFFRNCLLLDVQKRTLLTDSCSKEYPSICFYTNGFHYSAQCPDRYHAFHYMLNSGKCYGIEKTKTKLTFQEFLNSKCKTPMGNGQYWNLKRYFYSKISKVNEIRNDTWCWFASSINDSFNYTLSTHVYSTDIISVTLPPLVNVIDSSGSIGVMSPLSTLPCMACETDMIYGKTEMIFEYNQEMQKLYLIIYFPSGLWKYDSNDKGVQCFSDAEGFSRVININYLSAADNTDLPFNTTNSEKIVYLINLVTDRSARYWCEGHTKSFSLIKTEKIIVNPQGNQVHVFSLVLKLHLSETSNIIFSISNLTNNINSIFNVKKVLVMDILEYNLDDIHVLIHLHVAIDTDSEIGLNRKYETVGNLSFSLKNTLDFFKATAQIEFPKFNYTYINMSSSVYCLPTSSMDSIILHWDLTPIGHITAPTQFCLQANGLPVNRQCHGSYLFGSFWGKIEGQCDVTYKPSETTTFLFNFIHHETITNYVSKFITVCLGFILKDTEILIPADIYYLSLSFKYISDIAHQNISLIETGDIENIAWAMDRLMNVDKNNLRLAQTLNSTNAILEYTNNIIKLIAISNTTLPQKATIKNTYQLAVQQRFIIQISYAKFTNITGLVVIKSGSSDNFTDMTIKPLYKNTTIKEVLLIKDLLIATWLPHYVMENLQIIKSDTNKTSKIIDKGMLVVINVYKDNSVFQELRRKSHTVNSPIVEVTVPGYTTYLEYPIPLIFRNINKIGLPKACGYWNFQSEKGNIPGYWSKRGCILQSTIEELSLCECYHLTHFAQLLDIRTGQSSYHTMLDVKHEKVLNIITLIGSFLSLLGIIGIWITATVFESWRKKTGTKVLLQLSISIALPLILIIVFNLDNSIIVESQGSHIVPRNMIALCVGLGAIFHYSVLANFVWMLITAILQFIRYVRVLGVSRPSRFMIKLTIIGWGLPSIPVIIVLMIDYETYVPNPSSRRSFCYPNGLYMISGVVIPICMILFVNIILFLLVIKSISKSSDMQATDRSLVCAQFRLSIFLFFLLGLTWIFGIASFSGKLIWSYLFCVTSSVQGFVLFIYFIICDPYTRNMWMAVMKPELTRSRNSVTTISSG